MIENHPRMRQKRKLERKQGKRPPYATILIVCEGKETEPNYFEEIRQEKRLSSAWCLILPSALGTGPEKVVAYSKQLEREKGPWDEIYCVFDRDDHTGFNSAKQQIIDLNKRRVVNGKYKAIPSVPSFELWFVLHFELISKEVDRFEINQILKRMIQDYEKNLPDMFNTYKEYLPEAYKNANALRNRKSQTGNENPSTDVDILVQRLLSLKADSGAS